MLRHRNWQPALPVAGTRYSAIRHLPAARTPADPRPRTFRERWNRVDPSITGDVASVDSSSRGFTRHRFRHRHASEARKRGRNTDWPAIRGMPIASRVVPSAIRPNLADDMRGIVPYVYRWRSSGSDYHHHSADHPVLNSRTIPDLPGRGTRSPATGAPGFWISFPYGQHPNPPEVRLG